METKVKITDEQRKEATKKVIEGSVFQIVLKEANVKFKEAQLKSMGDMFSKEEKAQAQLTINMLKKQVREHIDILSFLQK